MVVVSIGRDVERPKEDGFIEVALESYLIHAGAYNILRRESELQRRVSETLFYLRDVRGSKCPVLGVERVKRYKSLQ